ncbi:hypothetical protein QTO34_016797 [Cnephaeus nilssonii]|uniref:Uncharacterized protein n=1 Tax=Cnephaeus nilssonii TaxID=3371016 RepID=A0AA40LSI0_CNENI|nr:hypothetical protein QTO34_016797 [Eptesicus nilssonii]
MHYFVLCRIDVDSKLEPNELASKAELWWCGDPLIPAGQAEGHHWCMNPCTRPLKEQCRQFGCQRVTYVTTMDPDKFFVP